MTKHLQAYVEDLDTRQNLIVEVPAQQNHIQIESLRKFHAPISPSERVAVSQMFRTLGTSSVDAFYRLMFPENASDRPLPVIFINAPPMSDKSAVCLQLYDKIVESKPKALLMRKNSALETCSWLTTVAVSKRSAPRSVIKLFSSTKRNSHTATSCCGEAS